MAVTLTDVRDALNHGEVVPSYQPQIELRSGKLIGLEVLARWQHPLQGLILPENFIALVEENGLINQLTQTILEQAFQMAGALPETLSLSVNVSPIQFRHPGLPQMIEKAASLYGFALRRLTIEITETALLTGTEEVQAIARALKQLGCKLSLDDFGTGYSSLSHLQSFPFDELKVDRSFVSSMMENRQSRKIVAAVIGLGQSLGLTTVAEGVETEEQADMLLWLRCDVAQGWLYGHPVPGEQILAMSSARSGRPLSASEGQREDPLAVSLETMPWHGLAHLRALYRSTSVGLCFLDRHLRFVSLNHRYADLNGLSISAHLGRTVKEVIPSVYPWIEPLLMRALQGESIQNEEVRRPVHGPGGEDVVVQLSYQPVADEGGELVGISVSIVDITECKRIEALLQESEESYRLMVDLNPQTPWVLDGEGNVLDVGSQWVEMTGLSKKDSLKFGWLDALHPDDVKRVMTTVRKSIYTREPMDVEYRVWDLRQCDWHWLRARALPRFDGFGKVHFWYGHFEEVHEPSNGERRNGEVPEHKDTIRVDK